MVCKPCFTRDLYHGYTGAASACPRGTDAGIVVAETAAARDIELITATQTNSDGMLFEIWTP